jgi:hypothetical protein
MADPFENKLVDKRVANRYVRKGVVDDKEYEKYVKALPDLADQAMPVEASMEDDDLDALDELDEDEAAGAAAATPEGGTGGGTPPA